MKRCTITLVLIASLLSLAAVGFNGCGKKNSITSITVTPADPFIAKETALQLSVTAYFSDGMSLTSWTQVTWQSSDPTVATVSSNGLVSAGKDGIAKITATDKAHPSITASVMVSVTTLEITPASATISAGTSTQQFTATAVFSDPSITPKDLTTLASWASTSTDVAVISNVTPSYVIVTRGTTTGTTTITATYVATGLTGTPATLTVE